MNYEHRDLMRNVLEPGDTVVAAFREQNVATLRVGLVMDVGVDYEPNVIRQVDTPKVPVIWVRWDITTHDYLPGRPTKIAARKALKVKTND